MRPPCETLTRSFLREVRRAIAISLAHEARMSQPQIAQILNVSQPVIHDYLREKSTLQPFDFTDTVGSTSKQILEQIKSNADADEMIRTLCSACHHLRVLGPFCHYHRESLPNLSITCTACLHSISEKEITIRSEVLEELNKANSLLSKLPNIHTIVPEIGMQLVFASEEAQGIEDIASFPGRLVKVKTQVVAMADPEFGISKTSSKILLSRIKIKPTERAMICIRNTDDIVAALRTMGYNVTETQGADQDWEGTLTELAHTNQLERINALADLGSPGFESLTYLFGETPITLTKTIEKLLQLM